MSHNYGGRGNTSRSAGTERDRTGPLLHTQCNKTMINITGNVRITRHWGVSLQICCCGKEISIIYSDCVFVALGIRMQCTCVILLSVACPALQHFSILPHNDTILKTCLRFLHQLFWTTSHLKKELKEMRSNIYIGFHVKYPLFLSDFNGTWVFLTDFRKNTKIYNATNIRPVEAELVHACKHAERQTDRHDEVNSRFSQLFERA
jgi:hypothetical protein